MSDDAGKGDLVALRNARAREILKDATILSAAERVAELERQNADLQAANTRYLLKARRLAEALEGFAFRSRQPGFEHAPDDSPCTFFCKDVRRAVDALEYKGD